jgi:hypothetical protein
MQVFHYRNKFIYIYIKVSFTTAPRGKIRKKVEEQRGERPKVIGVAAVPNLVPQTSARGQRLLQVFQEEIDHRHDFLS